MIIGFGGRIGSGKSELAKICQKAGFEKLYFALPLKQLVADLIHVKLEEINDLKNVEKDYKFGKIDYIFLWKETHIPYETIEKEMSPVKFKTVRQLLQFIGTDLIRKYNVNWHVNKIREMIDPKKNYIIDDVRFPNELNLIRELGGDCWFIIRPKIDNVSNHESETALTWRDFGNKIIINDDGLNLFKFRWETFFENYDKSMLTREKYLKSDCLANLYSEISESLSVFDILEISIHLFKYKERDFDCESIESVTQNSSGAVHILYKDGTTEVVKNPINIEDLKVCL